MIRYYPARESNVSTNPAHVPDPIGDRIADLEDTAITVGSIALRAYPGEFGVKVAARIVHRFAAEIAEAKGQAA